MPTIEPLTKYNFASSAENSPYSPSIKGIVFPLERSGTG
jgi:hypothetical protein